MNRTALKRILEWGAAPTPSALATPPQALAPVDDRVVTPMLKMSLDHFERAGCPLEVSVPWFSETLWFAPGQAFSSKRMTSMSIETGFPCSIRLFKQGSDRS